MANTVTVTKLVEGAKDAFFHVYVQGDGIAADLTNESIVDPTVDLSPTTSAVPTMTIVEIWYSVPAGNLIFSFNDLTPTPVWIVGNDSNHIAFEKFGGLKDRSGIDGTGSLLISTIGLQTSPRVYSFVIKVRKN